MRSKIDIANLANEKKRAKTIRFAPAYCVSAVGGIFVNVRLEESICIYTCTGGNHRFR